MRKIDTAYDNLLKVNYDLYATNFSDFRELAKSWYNDIDFKEFDNRFIRERDTLELKVMKKSGLLTNYFYAYVENDKWFLLDGFNRLFTDYGELYIDTPIYVKVITDELADNRLMSLMFNLNLWKLYNSGSSYSGFRLDDFIDRGFSLFLKTKFDIKLYYRKNYDERLRYDDDIRVLEKYFTHESSYSGDFKYDYGYVAALFLNENIVNDIRELIKSNDYITPPFGNYGMFLEGYAMFMSFSRLSKINDTKYTFDYFLNELYKDNKFFEKLKKMSGNDSTRKNIYNFYRNLTL